MIMMIMIIVGNVNILLVAACVIAIVHMIRSDLLSSVVIESLHLGFRVRTKPFVTAISWGLALP